MRNNTSLREKPLSLDMGCPVVPLSSSSPSLLTTRYYCGQLYIIEDKTRELLAYVKLAMGNSRKSLIVKLTKLELDEGRQFNFTSYFD